ARPLGTTHAALRQVTIEPGVHRVGDGARRRTQRDLTISERTLRADRALPLSAVAQAVGLKIVEHVRRTFPRVRPAALPERGALASSARRPLFPIDPPSPRTSVPRRAS